MCRRYTRTYMYTRAYIYGIDPVATYRNDDDVNDRWSLDDDAWST